MFQAKEVRQTHNCGEATELTETLSCSVAFRLQTAPKSNVFSCGLAIFEGSLRNKSARLVSDANQQVAGPTSGGLIGGDSSFRRVKAVISAFRFRKSLESVPWPTGPR